MVSHDFYNIVNCADYLLFADDKSMRPMRIRSFRKKIYENHFSKDYLELEQKKKELENELITIRCVIGFSLDKDSGENLSQ